MRVSGMARRGRRVRLALVCAVALGAALWQVRAVEARPGGGHTYSGSSSSSGGGSSGGGSSGGFSVSTDRDGWTSSDNWSSGGGGGGCVSFDRTLLMVLAPLFIVGFVASRIIKKQSWESDMTSQRTKSERLEDIRLQDPEFSAVLFEDFVFRLYPQAHGARANPADLDALAPYLSSSSRKHLRWREPREQPVSNVIIGAMRIKEVWVPRGPAVPGEPPATTSVTVEFESNMSVVSEEEPMTYFVVERWTFWRAANVVSKPPSAARDFPCPNCGGPFTSSDQQRCDHCGEVVDNGRFDWIAASIDLISEEPRPPMLTGAAPQRPSQFTAVNPQAHSQWAALRREDPEFTGDRLLARLTLIFTELNRAWCALDLTGARPYCSDGMFDYLQYWIDAYKQQGLRNVVDGARLERWALAKVVRDKHYDALTLHIWGAGRDYTVDVDTDAVVGGDRDTDSHYAEYWTLIRGASTRGAPRADKRCPGCGAELKITMAGNCAYCEVHVTSGEFDWVLSKIEQNDAYHG